jgi:hypothetical protein
MTCAFWDLPTPFENLQKAEKRYCFHVHLLESINKQDNKGELVHFGELPAVETARLKHLFLSQLATQCKNASSDLKTALTGAGSEHAQF